MNRDGKESFDCIKDELIQLHKRWIIYHQLYATNQHRIDILNATTPNLFAELQGLILDAFLLSLDRLTDPSMRGVNRDYSLFYLLDQIRKGKDTELYEELSGILKEIEKSATGLRTLRNNEHGRVTSAVSFNDKNAPFSGLKTADISRLLDNIMHFLNLIEFRYLRSVTRYDMIALPADEDARALLVWLKRALSSG